MTPATGLLEAGPIPRCIIESGTAASTRSVPYRPARGGMTGSRCAQARSVHLICLVDADARGLTLGVS